MKIKSSALAAFYNPRAVLGLTICLVGLTLGVFAFATKAGTAGGTQSGPGFVVNTLADTDDGSCDVLGQGTGNQDCTLREAINAANAYGSAATITFSVSGTITLASKLPNITNTNGTITIDSSGQNVIVSGNNSVPVLEVNYGATTTLQNLTIANGSDSSGFGAIYNSGTLNVTNSTLSNNSAPNDGQGGGVFNNGTLNVTNTTFSNNSATFGGAIHNNNGTVTVTNSTFSNNSAIDSGDSSMGGGGGIYNDGGTMTVTNSTLSGNSSPNGGGVYVNNDSVTLVNTIIANSPSGGNCFNNGATLTADSSNLADDNTCGSATQKTSAQINLQSLGDNGGPTQTFALGSGSAAIDKGDPNFAPPPSTDQRGAPRVVNGRIDVGAYEVQVAQQSGPSFVVTRTDDIDTGMCAPGFCSLREAINAGNAYNGAATITFNIPTTDSGYNSSTGVYTITLGSTLPKIASVNGLAIDGSGESITVSGNNSVGVMQVNSNANLTLLNVTVSNGFAVGDGSGIYNGGTLNVTNSTFSGNTAGGNGGGIFTEGGTIAVTNSTFFNNSAQISGGGIDNDNGTVIVINSTFSGNSVDFNGGGSVQGGGIYNNGTLTVVNSTFSGNSAPAAANAQGAGIYSDLGSVTLINTIIANSLSGGNCGNSATLTADSSNLADDNTCGSATVATSAQINLQPLADNGGPTDTMALGPGSVAINAGEDVTTLANNGGSINNSQTMFNVANSTPFPAGVGFAIQIDSEQMIVTAKSGNQLTVTRSSGTTHNDGAAVNPAFDQRGPGFHRKIGSAVDVGAFELDGLNITDSDPTANAVAEGAAAGTTVGLTASAPDADGLSVTYSLTGDTSGGGFTIGPSSGVVTVADSSKIDYESAPGHSYTVTVKADNGVAPATKDFVIAVSDVAPSTPIDSDSAANTVQEHSATGTTVGVTAFSTDVNGGTVTYSLTGDTSGGGFTINSSTGVVTVATGGKIGYAGSAPSHTYSITVQASDGTLASSQSFVIAVTSAKPQAHLGTANGTGTILANNNQASFSFNITDNNKKGTPSGSLSYTDSKGGIKLASTAITAISLVNNQATFSGKGTMPGSKPNKPVAVSFTAVAVDNGTPGAPKDPFTIQISSPYYANGNLTSGNIVVH